MRQLEFMDYGAVLLIVRHLQQDRRLVTGSVNTTKLAGLSVFEQE